jgi:homoserine O-acetyltransferase/O-succinyltransferase
VFAQRRLVDALGIARLALVTGFSMGAIQAYHWACAFPAMVARVAPVCGAAKTAHHTIVYLDGMERLMRLPVPDADMKETVGRCWAPWGLSQTFWREERWAALGAASRAEAVSAYAAGFAELDRYDMLAMLRTWRAADVGALACYGGDWRAALAAVEARALVMPGRTDCYFPPEDSAREVACLGDAELAVIESVFGHAAGANLDPADGAFVDARLTALLARTG